MIRKDSLFQFIFQQISKNNINRMNLSTFTRIIRKKVQDISTAQLLYCYRELERIKSNNIQFHTNSIFNNHNDRFKHHDKKKIMKIQSYEKHTLICLEEIAIKLKQKNGFQEGIDLVKLLYLRLLNTIEYNLPYFEILEQFKQQFLLKQVGEQIVDYIQLIGKDPGSLNTSFKETVEIIIQILGQELENIQVLKLPYIKAQLARAYNYGAYQVDKDLLLRIDQLIQQNKYAFTYKQLEYSISLQEKNSSVYELYALMSKDLVQKRVHYLHIDASNNQKNSQLQDNQNLKYGFPGKSIDQQSLNQAIQKINQVQLYKPYINVFYNLVGNQHTLKSNVILRQFINYHFKYLLISGNADIKSQYILQVIRNSIIEEVDECTKLKHISLNLLRLTYIIMSTMKPKTSYRQFLINNQLLNKQVSQLSVVQNLTHSNLQIAFENSLKKHIINPSNQTESIFIIDSILFFFKSKSQQQLLELFSEELEYLSANQKVLLTNQFIVWIISHVQVQKYQQQVEFMGKILQILTKLQYKKFSQQSANIQKIITLSKKKNNQTTKSVSNSSDGKQKLSNQNKQNTQAQKRQKQNLSTQLNSNQQQIQTIKINKLNFFDFQPWDQTNYQKKYSKQSFL